MKRKLVLFLTVCMLSTVTTGCVVNAKVNTKTQTKIVRTERQVKRVCKRKWHKKAKFVKSTAKGLYYTKRQRKGKSYVLIEKVYGICLDNKGNGIGNDGCYISYQRIKGVHKGSRVLTYLVWSPKNNTIDDIVYRYDVVLKK